MVTAVRSYILLATLLYITYKVCSALLHPLQWRMDFIRKILVSFCGPIADAACSDSPWNPLAAVQVGAHISSPCDLSRCSGKSVSIVDFPRPLDLFNDSWRNSVNRIRYESELTKLVRVHYRSLALLCLRTTHTCAMTGKIDSCSVLGLFPDFPNNLLGGWAITPVRATADKWIQPWRYQSLKGGKCRCR